MPYSSYIREVRNINRTAYTATGAAIFTALLLTIASFTPAGATGNGAPSGPHFNLNLIGAKTSNCPQTDSSGGNVIFVKLFGDSDIFLNQGTTFNVLDNNACTDGSASFQLPPTNTTGGAPAYTVWARVVGKPGGNGTLTTCATNATSLETICSLNQVITMRTHGAQKFVDVTSQLTTLCFINLLGQTTCVNIFSTQFQNFFWQYDNNGQKVLQLRFYPVTS
jgi:hypothetical protein